MAFIPVNFINGATTVEAAWLNGVDQIVYNILGGWQGQTLPIVQAALGIPSGGLSAPVTVAQGGTGAMTAAAGLANLGGISSAAAAALISSTVTQSYIAGLWQPQTAAETAAGVTPTNEYYAPGDLRRYGGDPTGVAASNTALTSAIAQSRQSYGVNVYVAPGTYNLGTGWSDVTGSVASGLRIFGAGKTVSTFFGTGFPLMNFQGTLYQDMILTDFGLGSGGNLITGVGVQISAVRGGSIFRNLAFNGSSTTTTGVGLKILGLSGGTYSGEFKVEDSTFYNLLTGCYFEGTMTSGSVLNSEFTNGVAIAGSVGVYIANTCYGQLVQGNQFSQIAVGIGTNAQSIMQLGNIFSDCTTYAFQWTLGAGNTYINNMSVGDRFVGCAPSYPTTSSLGCVVMGPLAAGVGNFEVGGVLDVGLSGTTGNLAFFGAAGQAGAQAGWGTPVGGAVVASYNITDAGGANSNTNKALAEVIALLKANGIMAA